MIDLTGLNNVQTQAVKCQNGPCLIIAGAGSGKTRVLTYKIAYLLEQGAQPSEVMALTFTNKASKEMKSRIAGLVGGKMASQLWSGTFHSIFAKILRKYSSLLGFPSTFTIYDTSDAKNAIKLCIKELQLDEKTYKPNLVLSRISAAKNHLVTAEAYMNNQAAIQKDMLAGKGKICEVYRKYSLKCKADGVMDFDDILLYMNILLRDFPEVLAELQSKISHILVDEYQDTNTAQYMIVKKIAQKCRNITVVGDDSQSIYAFRGAKIQNILNFKKDYPDAKEYRLEQNYRSTQTIVNAANSVIAHNSNRLKKECFSEGEKGEKIELIRSFSDVDEASSVVSSITRRLYETKCSYDSFTVLYRTNSQSRVIEEALRRRNIPYKIFAGHSFYERKEIKDVLAYMRLVINHNDNDAFRRIVNFPARGIGATSMEYLSRAASENGISLWDAVSFEDLARYGLKGAALQKFSAFKDLIGKFSESLLVDDAYQLAQKIVDESGIRAMMKMDQSVEGISRSENINELLNGVKEFVETEIEISEELGDTDKFVSLSDFMENVALLTDEDSDRDEDENNKVKLMTVHASKGLEFPYVYIIGMEENLFPSSMSMMEAEGVEEERRLFYVALTRAEKAVSVSYALSRFHNGETRNNSPSRFLKEIDPQYLNGMLPSRNETGTGSSVSSVSGNSFGRGTASTRFNTGSYSSYSQTSSSGRSADKLPDMSKLLKINSAQVRNSVESTSSEEFNVGDLVVHDRFGNGEVLSIIKEVTGTKAVVKFVVGGEKTLLLKYAKLQKLKK